MTETALKGNHIPLWKQIASSIDAALFPRRCIVCRTFLSTPGQDDGRAGFSAGSGVELESHLCPDCLGECRAIDSPLCSRCGRVFSSRTTGDHVCGECIKGAKPFQKARAWGVYDGALLKVVHSFKYHHKIYLAKPLGRLMCTIFRENWAPDEIDVVIPVPLHPKRLRQRGFNQSLLLVRQWSSDTDPATLPKLSPDWLARTRWTRSQTGLKRKERKANIRKAFTLQGRPHLKDKHILLVDDVYTTGATVAECARVLLAGGARRVDVLTLARAL